jgi:hypothetical protein
MNYCGYTFEANDASDLSDTIHARKFVLCGEDRRMMGSVLAGSI